MPLRKTQGHWKELVRGITLENVANSPYRKLKAVDFFGAGLTLLGSTLLIVRFLRLP